MTESTENIIVAIVIAITWMAWALFSETRHNHGILVALLMPLAPIIIPVLWIAFLLIKVTSYFVFIALGRRKEHEEFMIKLKIRSGVFLLI